MSSSSEEESITDDSQNICCVDGSEFEGRFQRCWEFRRQTAYCRASPERVMSIPSQLKSHCPALSECNFHLGIQIQYYFGKGCMQKIQQVSKLQYVDWTIPSLSTSS